MGLYINPPTKSKEDWLTDNGALMLTVPNEYKSVGATGTYWLVCLVDNPTFSAAGVCYSQQELEEWRHPGDKRPKRWYLVEQDRLLTVVPDLLQWEEEALQRGRW